MGNSFYGKQRMFTPDFIAWLAEFQLPDYHLRTKDGRFEVKKKGWQQISSPPYLPLPEVAPKFRPQQG